MARIAIMAPCIMTGDAVGNDVLGMHRVLASHGHDVRLFADCWNISEPSVGFVHEARHFLRDKSATLLYHHAIGWSAGLKLLKTAFCRKIVRYHNVTPARFFEGIDPESSALCRVGRQQLKLLVQCSCDLFLAASEFNRQELVAEGVDETISFVVPPFHHLDRLHAIEADESVLDACRDGKTNILFVGRISPNKGHAALINAFAAYHHHYDDNSRLLLVGKETVPMEPYTYQLQQQVRRLGLAPAVVFTGEATDQALKSYYLIADVFMSASEHEGFCVPLVEAMAMKLPIVAYGSTAIPETVGQSGFVWEAPDPYLMAESVACIMRDRKVRTTLGEKGWERYKQKFATSRIEANFLAALKRVR